MKTLLVNAMIGAAILTGATTALKAGEERLSNAATVLNEMAAATDAGIPRSFIEKAKCLVVVPGVKKAAFGVGGQYGRGYIVCRTSTGWSAPGGIRIEGGSFGLQIGGTDTDVIMLVLNDRGVDRLLSSKFTVGADASVAAGPVGRQAAAQTDATMMAEILAWSRARGVFAGIALQGSTLREDTSENRELYGGLVTNKAVVKGGHAAPKGSADLMAALAKY